MGMSVLSIFLSIHFSILLSISLSVFVIFFCILTGKESAEYCCGKFLLLTVNKNSVMYFNWPVCRLLILA